MAEIRSDQCQVMDSYFGPTDNDEYKALMMTAQRGHKEIVEKLIRNSVDVNADDDAGQRMIKGRRVFPACHPMNCDIVNAASARNIEDITRLLRNGIDIDSTNDYDDGYYSALHVAVLNNTDGQYDNVIDFLINNGANIDTMNSMGETPLLDAAQNGDDITMLKLARAGADLDIEEDNGRDYADLYRGDADMDELSEQLLQAKEQGRKRMVKAARASPPRSLARSLSRSPARSLSRSPIRSPIRSGGRSPPREIIPMQNKQQQLNIQLHEASLEGDKKLVENLIVEGSDVNSIDDEGRTAIYLAIRNTYTAPEIVKILIKNGADVNIPLEGYTPLMLAVNRGAREIVQILIDAGADVNVPTAHGGTALSAAAVRGNRVIIAILIAAGANPEMRTNDGQTARDLYVGDETEFDRIVEENTPERMVKAARDSPPRSSSIGRSSPRFPAR